MPTQPDEEMLGLARDANHVIETFRARANGMRRRAAARLLTVAMEEAFDQGLSELDMTEMVFRRARERDRATLLANGGGDVLGTLRKD